MYYVERVFLMNIFFRSLVQHKSTIEYIWGHLSKNHNNEINQKITLRNISAAISSQVDSVSIPTMWKFQFPPNFSPISLLYSPILCKLDNFTLWNHNFHMVCIHLCSYMLLRVIHHLETFFARNLISGIRKYGTKPDLVLFT